MANSTENITEIPDRGVNSPVIGLEMSSSDWFINVTSLLVVFCLSQICASSLPSNHQLT